MEEGNTIQLDIKKEAFVVKKHNWMCVSALLADFGKRKVTN